MLTGIPYVILRCSYFVQSIDCENCELDHEQTLNCARIVRIMPFDGHKGTLQMGE